MKETTKNIIVFASILILMFLLLVAVLALVKNIQLIKKSPLDYGMQQNKFTSCLCLDNSSRTWISNGSGFHTEQPTFTLTP